MKLEKSRQLKDQDLVKEIDKIKNMIAKLQSELSIHKLKNYRSLRVNKKYLAQLLTIKQEKEIIIKTQNQNVIS